MRKGELENRLDSLFYIDRIDYSKFIKLSKIAKISGGKRLPLGHEFSTVSTKYRYLRVGDIDWNGNLDYQNFNYLLEETYRTLSRYEIFDNELLIAIVGATIGKVALLKNNTDEKIILTENCAKISVKTPHVLPQYLLAVLQSQLVQKQIQLNYIQTTLPKLGLERLEALKIPIPPDLYIQTKITDLLNAAHLSKSQKEAEATELLAGIDGYLLQALGITLPPASAPKKCFYTRASKVNSGRLDPFYHRSELEELEQSLVNGGCQTKKLGYFLNQISYGASVKNEYAKDGIPFLRISDLKRNEISIKEIMYLPESMRKNLGSAFVFEGDFLISRSGTLGVVAIVENDINGFAYGSFMIKFTLNKDSPIDKNYLSYFLNCEAMQKIIAKNKIGAIQGNITIPTIRNLQIPLPPLEKQIEIANHINQIRAQAKQLQQEAQAELEATKQQVEKMILGEA